MKRFKIVETKGKYGRYCEVYQRFLGFLWWRKWKGFQVADYNEAAKAIWMVFSQDMSDIEKAITIINYFVYLKDDELVNEFPLDTYNILKQAVKTAEELLKINDYTQNEIFRYKNCIDDGYRVLNTSTVRALYIPI